MQASVTFRHMESSDAARSHTQEKAEKLKKYVADPLSMHVVLSSDNNHRYTADVQLVLHDGTLLKAEESAYDLYIAIDMTMEKLEGQVRKHKEKSRDH